MLDSFSVFAQQAAWSCATGSSTAGACCVPNKRSGNKKGKQQHAFRLAGAQSCKEGLTAAVGSDGKLRVLCSTLPETAILFPALHRRPGNNSLSSEKVSQPPERAQSFSVRAKPRMDGNGAPPIYAWNVSCEFVVFWTISWFSPWTFTQPSWWLNRRSWDGAPSCAGVPDGSGYRRHSADGQFAQESAQWWSDPGGRRAIQLEIYVKSVIKMWAWLSCYD